MADKENCASSSKQLKVSGATKMKSFCASGDALVPKSDAPALKAAKKVSTVAGTLDLVKICKEVNTEEDVVFETKTTPWRTQLRCDDDAEQQTFRDGWIKSAPGSLKLYRHKTTGKTRLVQRNRIGTVKLNLPVGEGMKDLEKVTKQLKKHGRKAKEVAYVRFIAQADEEAGLEMFLLKVKPEKLEMLFYLLKGMGAEVKEE